MASDRIISISIGRPMRCFRVMPSRNSMAMKALTVVLTDVVDGADVGMIQCRSSLSLALKTFQRLRVMRDIFRQELEGDEAAETVSSAL